MCGIAGAVNHPLDIPRLTKDLWHRGPDEQATFTETGCQLHHHRLAILDIAGGKQPMQFGELTIIFNGEIYNHRQLRERFNLNACRTSSDTETILHLYAKLGADCLREMDGMFTIAIYDRARRQLFLARDRAGKKPLYYYKNGQAFLFASELNALKNQLSFKLNNTYIREFIRTGFFYKSHTPYENVFELPAGSYCMVPLNDPGKAEIRQWWDIAAFYENRSSDDERTAIDKVESYLHTAIRNRVESSDLEVGSFLSGGIDSGLVTAIASSYNKNIQTFTMSFEGQYNEAPLAKLVADKYGTRHHELQISFSSLKDDVEKILSNYGEPFYDDSAIPSYYVSREARKYLTVILNGDGGDEIFGGYRRYVPFTKMDLFKTSPFRQNAFSLARKLIPASDNKMSRMNYVRRMMFLGSSDGLDSYLRATTDIFEGYSDKAFVDRNMVSNDLVKDLGWVFHSGLTGLQKIMLLDFRTILPSILLVKMDIATMANSQEGRSPLLAKDILEYVPSLQDNLKIRGTQTKYLLRKLAEKYLPAELIHQPKRGFEVPLQKWVNRELKDVIGDYLTGNSAFYKQVVRQDFVHSLLNNSLRVEAEKRAKMIWLLFTLEVWYKKVYKEE